jgi:hypothetical protein
VRRSRSPFRHSATVQVRIPDRSRVDLESRSSCRDPVGGVVPPLVGVFELAARVCATCSKPVLPPRLSVALRGPPRNRCAFVPSAASCRLSLAAIGGASAEASDVRTSRALGAASCGLHEPAGRPRRRPHPAGCHRAVVRGKGYLYAGFALKTARVTGGVRAASRGSCAGASWSIGRRRPCRLGFTRRRDERRAASRGVIRACVGAMPCRTAGPLRGDGGRSAPASAGP